MYPIEVRNADGSLQFDISFRLFRRLTLHSTGTNDGSVSLSGLGQGTMVAAEVSNPPSGVTPQVSSTGSAVNWTFGSAPMADRRSVTLAIGVY